MRLNLPHAVKRLHEEKAEVHGSKSEDGKQ